MAGTMRQRPVILTSRTISAMVPPGARGNVAWNEDGQCLFLTKRAVVILTPYLTTTLPPPLALVDPNLNFEYPISVVLRERKIRAEKLREESMDPEVDTPGESTPQPTINAEAGPSQPRRVAKPRGGEVKWWSTSVEVDKEEKRDKFYDWTDSGDEFGGTLGGKEVFVKSAIWSPSGLSELGGSLLAVMTTSGQVSIYTPRTNATSKQWDEIADMTIQTRDMLGAEDLTVPIILQMRMISMAWSTTPPAVEMLGMDGSLLALASRAGMVALWTYGPERQFTCDAYLKVSDEGWVTQMAWSPWHQIGPARYEARLALALTECSIAYVPIQRGRNAGGGWDLTFGTMDWIDYGDRRVITALKWIDGLLVWAKSGSIHLWASGEGVVEWKGVQEVRLDRVGNWAGANPLGSCIGIEVLDSDRLVVTLASLTQHIITDIRTSPTLAPHSDSLRLSLGVRDCAIGHLKEDRKPIPDERQLSVITTGLSAVGSNANISCWASEIMNLHNLDSANEGVRSMIFVMADLGGVSGTTDDLLPGLRQVMSSPPPVLQSSPLRILQPFIMRILTILDPDSLVDTLLEICSSEPGSLGPEDQADEMTQDERLMRALWANAMLDGMRLRMILARWAMSAFPPARRRFEEVVASLESRIYSTIVAALARWLAAKIEALPDLKLLNPSETEFAGLVALSSTSDATSSKLRTLIGNPDIQQQCPICSSLVDHGAGGTTTCSKGHEWARCCLTQTLITTPAHRICSICPAVSLLPERYKSHPIPVAEDGTATDWQRFRVSGENREAERSGAGEPMEGIEGSGIAAEDQAAAIDTRLSTTRRDLVQLALEAGVYHPYVMRAMHHVPLSAPLSPGAAFSPGQTAKKRFGIAAKCLSEDLAILVILSEPIRESRPHRVSSRSGGK